MVCPNVCFVVAIKMFLKQCNHFQIKSYSSMHKVDKKGFYVLNILQNLILLPNVLSIKLMRMRLFDLAQNFELIITDKNICFSIQIISILLLVLLS